MRSYYYQWVHNDSRILRDKRGKHSREMIVVEDDIGKKLRKWARKHADQPHFVDNATKYINEVLLPGLPANVLTEYKITLPIARSTAHRWLGAADIRNGWATQNYYNDNHQNPLVLEQRAGYIPVREELERRQPLDPDHRIAEGGHGEAAGAQARSEASQGGGIQAEAQT